MDYNFVNEVAVIDATSRSCNNDFEHFIIFLFIDY